MRIRLRIRALRIRVTSSTLLDLFGAGCIAGFAYFCWPPLALLVVGVASILISWARR